MATRVALGLLLCAPGAPVWAADTSPDQVTDTVRVGTRVVPPFVIRDDSGGYTGIAIRLWEHVAEEAGIPYVLEERSLEGLLSGVSDGSLFASVAALTITAEREERIDFTHPFFTTGLAIAVPDRPAGLFATLRGLISADFLWVLGLLVGLLFVWGALVWFFERRGNPEEFGGSAAQGLASGFWWAAVTMTTVGYGDKAPRTFAGRVVGFLWMFTAIIVISFFTASIASSLTVNQLGDRISGPRDLPAVRVGHLEASIGATYLAEAAIPSTPYASVPDGLSALAAGDLDAFVHDEPVLRYYARDEFRGRARVLPGTFLEQFYGIALPEGSERREPLSRSILEFVASPAWAELLRRHLGAE